ncbi:hypothetical protein [Streptomyces tropicalis]|uniref:Transposase n=1 Tax=Streptomyces tropicalis TaxID=3034234 RepID=A0ABT6A7F7_9ACTN|nr:hypothetical protein [Streptomyces tropicalis]MDF3300408.1 hypothetical protein [Streptomyces tropicalis]
MPEPMSRHQRAALGFLNPGEQLQTFGVVVPAKSAKGSGHGQIGGDLGGMLARSVGAQSGGAGSVASGLPATSGAALLLRVTDQRVGLVDPLRGTPVWEVPRTWVARVERRPRLQLMARFRVHYCDGSWLAFLTMRRRTAEQFGAWLG